MTTKKAPKKRNPQDATLRNIRALKSRANVLARRCWHLERRYASMAASVEALESALKVVVQVGGIGRAVDAMNAGPKRKGTGK